MICSSLNCLFLSNLRRLRNWTPNQPASQNRADVALGVSVTKGTRSMSNLSLFANKRFERNAQSTHVFNLVEQISVKEGAGGKPILIENQLQLIFLGFGIQ